MITLSSGKDVIVEGTEHACSESSSRRGCWQLPALPAVVSAQGAPVALTAADQPFKRGVNVLGYDPYWTDAGKRRFEWRHFAEIRKAGFDFVRVNLQAFSHMDAQNRLDPAWLAKLDDVVAQAQARRPRRDPRRA